MEFLNAYEVEGFADFIASLFALIPVGFLLGLFCGLLAFGIFGIVRLLKSLIK